MTEDKKVEIICSACGKESFVMRKPIYEGFKKIGETLSCAACGHVYASEAEVPFKTETRPRIFTEADRSRQVHVFEKNEASRLCRYCAHYVVNPFMQWCGHHRREVEATDTCDDFIPRQPPQKPELPL